MKYVISRDLEGVYVEEVKDDELINYINNLKRAGVNEPDIMVMSKEQFITLGIVGKEYFDKYKLDIYEEEPIKYVDKELETFRFVFQQHVDIKAPSKKEANDIFEEMDLQSYENEIEFRDVVDIFSVE